MLGSLSVNYYEISCGININSLRLMWTTFKDLQALKAFAHSYLVSCGIVMPMENRPSSNANEPRLSGNPYLAIRISIPGARWLGVNHHQRDCSTFGDPQSKLTSPICRPVSFSSEYSHSEPHSSLHSLDCWNAHHQTSSRFCQALRKHSNLGQMVLSDDMARVNESRGKICFARCSLIQFGMVRIGKEEEMSGVLENDWACIIVKYI